MTKDASLPFAPGTFTSSNPPPQLNPPPPPPPPLPSSFISSTSRERTFHNSKNQRNYNKPSTSYPPYRNMTLVNLNHQTPTVPPSYRPQQIPPPTPPTESQFNYNNDNHHHHHQHHQQHHQQPRAPPPQQYNPSGIYPGITAPFPHPLQPSSRLQNISKYSTLITDDPYRLQRHQAVNPALLPAPPTVPLSHRQPLANVPTHNDPPHTPHPGQLAGLPNVSQSSPLLFPTNPSTTPNRFSNDGSFLAQFLESQKKTNNSNSQQSATLDAELSSPKTACREPSTKKNQEIEPQPPFAGKNALPQTLATKKILSRPTGFKKVSRSSTPADAFNGRLKRPAYDSSDRPQSIKTEAFDLPAEKKSKMASDTELLTDVRAEKYDLGDIADDVKETIDKAAEFVSRHGEGFLGILKEKNKSDPKFNFLFNETTPEHQLFKQRLDEKDAEMNLIAKQELQRDIAVTVPSAVPTLATKPTGVNYRPPLPEPVHVDAVSLGPNHQFELPTRTSVGTAPSASKNLGITFSMSMKDAMPKPTFSISHTSPGELCTVGSAKKKSRWGQMNPASNLEIPNAAIPTGQSPMVLGGGSYSGSHANVKQSSSEERKPQPVYSKYSDAYSPGMIQVGKRWAWPEDEIVDEKDGTYEHIKRKREMEETARIANILTAAADSRRAHHIGQYLPKQELERFEASVNAARASKSGGNGGTSESIREHEDHAESKLDATNLGYRMLKNAGWEEGAGLGKDGSGIAKPVNRGTQRPDKKGLGQESAEEVTADDDEFSIFRKKMMLAYKFRPNPLNNPRRPY